MISLLTAAAAASSANRDESLVGMLIRGVDSRLRGKDAGDSLLMWDGDARNPLLWCGDVLNISALPKAISTYQVHLVAPDVVIFANHHGPAINQEWLTWLDDDDVDHTSQISERIQIGSTDIALGKLTNSMPSSIGVAKVLSDADWAALLAQINAGTARIPVMSTSQYGHATVRDLAFIAGQSQGADLYFSEPSNAKRLEFHEDVITGDSGGWAGGIYRSELVIFGTWSDDGINDEGSLPSVHYNKAAINAGMEALGSLYRLTEVGNDPVEVTPVPTSDTFERFGMTLTLTEPVQYFIDAVGGQIPKQPFTIASITNADAAMINPSCHADQALLPGAASPEDGVGYDEDLNILNSLPYTVDFDCTIAAVIHQALSPPENTYFRRCSYWTALETLPTAPCVSPPYAGTDKTIAAEWYVSAWNKPALRDFPVPSPLPANYPDEQWMLDAIEQRLLDICPAGSTVNGWMKAADNAEFPQRTYGQNIGPISNSICQWLNLDTGSANRDQILARMMQWAVDNLGIIRTGGAWTSTGMHSLGRGQPNVLAAAVMGGVEMLASITDKFIEFYTYDYVSQNDIDTPRTRYWPSNQTTTFVDPYTQDMLGRAEWFSALWQKDSCTPNWAQEQGYRSGNSGEAIGTVWLAQVLGLREQMDHEALFEYMENYYWPAVSESDGLLQDLWAAHYNE